MKEYFIREIEVISAVHIIAIIFAVIFLTIFYIRLKPASYTKAFFVLQLSIIGWMFFKILKTVAPNVTMRWTFVVCYYFCICVLEVSLLLFSYSYCKGEKLAPTFRYALFLLASIQFMVIITNPFHYLFYRDFDFTDDHFGILFYVHALIQYILVIISYYYGYLAFKIKMKKLNYFYKICIALAIFIPISIHLLYVTRKIFPLFIYYDWVIFDISPITFLVSVSMFLIITMQRNFLDLKPLLKYEIIDKMDTAICLLDGYSNIIYANQNSLDLLNDTQINILKAELRNTFLGQNSGIITCQDKQVSFHSSESINKFSAYKLLTLNDVTDLLLLEKEIKGQQEILNYRNKVLKEDIFELRESSKIGARKYIARELHDIIGHSLVVAIKSLESALLYWDSEPQYAEDARIKSLNALEQGLEEMEKISLNKNRSSSLQSELLEMLNQVDFTGINSRLLVKGNLSILLPKISATTKRICQELLTNVLKHSQASEVLLQLNLNTSNLTIRVIDNGIGVDSISSGNGLQGILERAKELGGSAEFSSVKGDGFTAVVVIPM